MRVNTTGLPTDNWHHFLRLRDLRQILGEFQLDANAKVLELGAGDGVQTQALRDVFREVIATDINPSASIDGLVLADASRLPFVDGHFDLIFSSNVLEHVEDLDGCFSEMKRVLATDGIMIHSMPTGNWKIIQVVGRPWASASRLIRKLVPRLQTTTQRAPAGSHGAQFGIGQRKRSLRERLIGRFIPTIHGVSGNHLQEFIRFRPTWWMKTFESAELTCFRSSPLFLHSPYDLFPYKLIGMRDRIARMGIASVQVYWLK